MATYDSILHKGMCMKGVPRVRGEESAPPPRSMLAYMLLLCKSEKYATFFCKRTALHWPLAWANGL